MPLNTRIPSGAMSRGLGSLRRRRGTPRRRELPPSLRRMGGEDTTIAPPPRRSGGLASLSRGQRSLLRGAQEHARNTGQNPAALQELTARHGNMLPSRPPPPPRQMPSQMMRNGGSPANRLLSLSRGGVPMLANGQAVPPQIAKTGGARLDAMRGAGGPPMGGPPMGGPPPPPMAPPPMAPPPQLAGGMPPMMPREEEPIEEEGGISGLPTAIVDTLVSNTSGVDEALAVLDEARNELISIAGEEDVAMEDEGMLMGEEEEIGGMLEAMLG